MTYEIIHFFDKGMFPRPAFACLMTTGKYTNKVEDVTCVECWTAVRRLAAGTLPMAEER